MNDGITLLLDNHEMMQYVRGAGSSSCQDIWDKLVDRYQRKMSDDMQDYIWAMAMRDLWSFYFKPLTETDGELVKVSFGHEGFLRFLAAYNYRNRMLLSVRDDNNKNILVEAYRFQGKWWLLHSTTKYVPEERIVMERKRIACQNHKNPHLSWQPDSIYEDLSIYNRSID